MRTFSNIAAVATFLSVAFADNAPVAKNNPMGVTYSATLPATDSTALSGAFKASAAPDGDGVSILISLYNLPSQSGNLSYGIHTGNAGKNGDCSGVGGVLNPYGGVTGAQCATNGASCQVGDLSDKQGEIVVATGGSGTGYFAANYVDKYLSLKSGNEAFFGKGSIVVVDASGSTVTCANFVNADEAVSSSSNSTASATQTTASMSSASASGSGSSSGSTTTSAGIAAITAAPVIGVGILGLAALLI